MTPFEKLKAEVIQRMRDGLPNHLTYHCVDHTLMVIKRSMYIAEKEGLSKDQLILLKTAALFHDFGFTIVYKDHEEKGCEIVTKELPGHGYSNEQIEAICGMIRATKIPQNPLTLAEMIIADADLEYLGSNQFKPIGDLLYMELKHFNPNLSVKEWNDIQIKFMTGHHYHTHYCKKYRQWRKRRNLNALKQ